MRRRRRWPVLVDVLALFKLLMTGAMLGVTILLMWFLLWELAK
jgi:hypothetical protein